jgi:hypothetical protein
VSISETVSKKLKRGRPRAVVREILRGGGPMQGCDRTRVNWAYRVVAVGLFTGLPDDDQRAVWGCTGADISTGRGHFPPGWDTAAEEIGRLVVHESPDDEQQKAYADTVVTARRAGRSWSDIRGHFRALRIGSRAGNAGALLSELCRVVDEYRARFPATDHAQCVSAVEQLLEIVQVHLGAEVAP